MALLWKFNSLIMSLQIGVLESSRAGGVPFLLDEYPSATIGFSLRKLRAAYTGSCIRVRRSSDNTTLDIGFVNNIIDSTTLLTFCGAGNGFISIWYDQSGFGNNAQSVILAEQCQIVFSGSLLYRNSKIYFTATTAQEFKLTTVLTGTSANNYSWFYIYEKDTAGAQAMFTNGGGQYLWLDYNTNQYVNSSQAVNISPNSYSANIQYLVNNNIASSVASCFSNNVLLGSLTPITGSYNFYEFPLNAIRTAKITLTELIFYPNSQLANRTGINANINTYYTIF